MTELYCDYRTNEFGDCEYTVVDADHILVASGVSSSPEWVKHDAGGFHTQQNFDKRYGAGKWHVSYAWEPTHD